MELAGAESRTRLRKEGAPLKLISTGWPRRSTAIFGSKEPSPRWVPWQQPTRASAFRAVLFKRPIKSGRPGFFFCYVASLTLSLVHSSASPFLSEHDMVLALFTREAVRRLHKSGVCGNMLPDNPGACDREGKLIWSGTKRELVEIDCQGYVLVIG